MDRNDRLVTQLVREGAIVDPRIEGAFRQVERQWFLPDTDPDEVYRDAAVVTHRSPDGIPISSSSAPGIMARMLGQLAVRPGDRVLEIGTGTGYNAALLARLAGPGGQVVTIEVAPDIGALARRRLADAGTSNVSVVVGDGWAGVADSGRFDRIEATVGVWDLPADWVAHLRSDGLLVAPLWLRTGVQASVAFRRAGAHLEAVSIEPCGFMRLVGPGAGDATYEQIGPWTVSFDRPNPARLGLLRQLLGGPPLVEPAPSLSAGWFTPVALRHPDAVHIYSLGRDGPVIGRGILDAGGPGLAVVVSHPVDGDTVWTFGGPAGRERLLDVLRDEAPVELERLAVTAIPAGEPVDTTRAWTTFARPNFSFVLSTR